MRPDTIIRVFAAAIMAVVMAACTTGPADDYIPPPPPPPKPGQVIKPDPARVRLSFDVRTYAADDFDVWMRIGNAPGLQAALQLSEMHGAELCLEKGYKYYRPTEQGLVRGQSDYVHTRVKCTRVYAEKQNLKTAANTIRLVRRAYGLP